MNSTKDNRVKLNKTVCQNATYQGKGKKGFYALWDSEVRGFGLRISEKGSKQFIIMYRHLNRKRMMTLGPFGVLSVDQARKMAIQKLAEAAQGKDPAEEKLRNRKTATMKDLCKDYLENHAKVYKKTWEGDRYRIDREINPAFGSRPITSITRRDVMMFHSKKGNTAPYEANRILSLLSAIFEYAKREGYLPDQHANPARGIGKFKETKRDRWVTQEEIPRLLIEINKEPNIYLRSAYWLYLFTGVRKTELLKAKWEDVNFQLRELRLEETKSGRRHYVHLSQLAIDILKSIPRQSGNPYILPGRKKGSHLVNIERCWREIRKAANLEDVRIHDLRRTVGSWLATSGTPLQHIGKILNHSSTSTTEIYAHLGDDPLKKAMNEHGDKLLEFVKMSKMQNEEEAAS